MATLERPHPSLLSFSIRTRLMVAMGVLVVILVLVGIAAPGAVARLRGEVHQAVQVDGLMARLAGDVALKAEAARRFDQSYFLHVESATERVAYHQRWEAAATDLQASIAAFALAASQDEDKRQARLWSAAYGLYSDGFRSVVDEVEAGRIVTGEDADARLNTYKQNIQTLADLSDGFAAHKQAAADRSITMLDASSMWLSIALGSLCALGILVAIAWTLYFPVRLTRPLGTLSAAAKQLAAGDLTARTGLTGDDEIGALAHAFDQMAATVEQRTADLQAQFVAAEAARCEAEEARAQVAEQLATIAAQRNAIEEMSVPILPVARGVLVMPIVGALAGDRIAQAQERALEAVQSSRASFLIIDITGVPVVDTQVALGIMEIVNATNLLGARALLVGIRPEVAQTIVGLGIDLGEIVTRATLEAGVSYTAQATNGTHHKGPRR